MNPGIVVKLRPAGPWRIGPDSGARNRVDVIYHSDSLYSAVTSAMVRMGALEEWLDATARSGAPAVSFGSCFPFLDEIGFVVPPRTVWPPGTPALKSARVRWKSARFVPLGIVQAILAGQTLDEDQWSLDGPSECLVPAGRPGPFRTSVRWSAAVDRLTGATERHATACIEFRPGAGLWTVVSFAGESARTRWSGPVKAAFRLLADSGFGGERSRGWGRAETPEFVEGMLPEMILKQGNGGRAEAEPVSDDSDASVRAAQPAVEAVIPLHQPAPEGDASSEVLEASVPPTADVQTPAAGDSEAGDQAPETDGGAASNIEGEAAVSPAADVEATASGSEATAEIETGEAVVPPAADTQSAGPRPPAPASGGAHWFLSLYVPAAGDSVDWRRGNYSLLARGGRIESAAGSGELKKQVQMVTEGSVLYAGEAPLGSAPDVAPEGFAHPVFRAGFAVSIPLPEVG
jgi:CRISPR type III-A-associated RAMP protein Csm4